MWCHVISLQRWAWVTITTHASSPVLLSKGYTVSKHVLHCSNKLTHHRAVVTLCFVSIQEIARHLRPAALRALYGKNKVQNGIHCTDLPEDGILEVSSCKSHSNSMLCKRHTVTFCLRPRFTRFEDVCLPSKIFLVPTNANEAQNKMASRSHDCPQWAEADLQPSVSHRKGCRRIESVW